MGTDSVSYKLKVSSTENGRKRNRTETRTVPQADIDKIKETTLYKVLLIIKSLHPLVWEHLFDVDAGVAVDTNSKKPSCWSSLCEKHLENKINISDEVLTSKEDFEMTPAMTRMTETANSYDYETWHDINIWGKETGLISPRDTAFMGSIYYWCKRGKELTYKQARYAMRVLEMARSKGWEE